MGNTQANMCTCIASGAAATARAGEGGKINEIHSQYIISYPPLGAKGSGFVWFGFLFLPVFICDFFAAVPERESRNRETSGYLVGPSQPSQGLQAHP